ncbi:MAG: hypothetical protein GY856_04020, partial [bacterium]|nr:hypothetical protein [bacterium]
MRQMIAYLLLRTVKALSHTLYTVEDEWISTPPEGHWSQYRLVALFNHTSLYEFLYADMAPVSFLRRIARHGVVPIASKTMNRRVAGRFWKFIAGHVVPISRERDDTWTRLLEAVKPQSVVVMMPEGRMKRANGLDAHGRPLVIRGGVADVIRLIPDGKMLLGYSQGLHHVQIPGQMFPKLFKRIRMRFEALDIEDYRASLWPPDGDE